MEPATSIASQVRTARISAVEIVSGVLEAAEASHRELNAFTLIDRSGAMHRAEAVDRLVAAGKDPGPLAGVPIAIKDIIDDAGMPTSAGSSFPATLAEKSSPVVRRLGAAGAIIVGRTGLHEFAFGFTSENPWFGPVRNPWDTSTSPGGSSGGSGAAVAAGITPIGIGTDTGGSIRVPAAMCGVIGLKVTHGRIPLTGVFPLVESLDTVGPIARTVGDIAAAYAVMAGDDPSDPWSQPVPVDRSGRAEMEDLRLGIVKQWLTAPTASAVSAGLEQFVSACEAAGASVVEIDAPVLSPPPTLLPAIGPEILEVHRSRFAANPERYGDDTAERIRTAYAGTADDLLDANRWGIAAAAAVSRLSDEGIDALISPTVGVLHKQIGVDTVEVDGERIPHRLAMAAFTSPINRMHVPALAVPVARTAGQGVSVQLVGPMWSESRLIAIGLALEAARVVEVGRPPIFFGETTE